MEWYKKYNNDLNLELLLVHFLNFIDGVTVVLLLALRDHSIDMLNANTANLSDLT